MAHVRRIPCFFVFEKPEASVLFYSTRDATRDDSADFEEMDFARSIIPRVGTGSPDSPLWDDSRTSSTRNLSRDHAAVK